MINIVETDLLVCTPCQFLDLMETTYTTKVAGTLVPIVLVVFLKQVLLVISDRLDWRLLLLLLKNRGTSKFDVLTDF